jgi:hypothetical protein
MEIMRPRLLVVGDSFFHRDPEFPGQHWSEMLPDYEIDNRACSGNSIGIILRDLVHGLECSPDAVVIGFTGSDRIEFKNTNPYIDREWITSCHRHELNQDQKLLMTLYQLFTVPAWNIAGVGWQIIGALHTLKSLNIPFVYSLGMFECVLDDTANLEQSSMSCIVDQFSQFDKHKIDFNLATYPPAWQTSSPMFHVPDPKWQQKFAAEVTTKLKMIDTPSIDLL